MDLYYSSSSFECHKVRMMLEEKGLPCQLCHVDLVGASNLEPWFLHINPKGTVPVLVHGSSVVTDTNEILRFFDSIGQPMGGSIVDHDAAATWLTRVAAWDEEALAYSKMSLSAAQSITRFRRRVCVERMARNPDLVSAYGALLARYQTLEATIAAGHAATTSLRQLEALLDEAERTLSNPNNVFLAGREASIADVCFAPVLASVDRAGLSQKLLKTRPALAEYNKRMTRRQSFRTAVVWPTSLVAKFANVPAMVALGCRRLSRRY
ncbi:hypothetical protein CLOM_g20592 [Closterium sp. NIES-68]|nr:hypothetical protein CLOM_g20592 [Closterium sp. NIES-68]